MNIIQTFNLPTKIIFGPEAARELAEEGRVFGGKVMVVTGRNALIGSGSWRRIEVLMRGSGYTVIPFSEVEPEPSLDTTKKGLALAREQQVDWVVGLGGGSAMDTAKVIAGLYGTSNEIDYYFNGGKLLEPGIPLVTIPTTSGSGAEVTINAVLIDRERGVKQSIRDQLLAAKVAIVDPQLTVTMPDSVTLNSGMDALTQAIEAFTSKGASPLSDIYAYAAIERIYGNLMKVYHDGQDIAARTEMALGSLMAGIALGSARLGAVHGLAHPIGARTGKPHGLICAVLLVPVMRFNLGACYEKYVSVTKALGLSTNLADPIDVAAHGIKNIMSLQRKLGLPTRISQLGVAEDDILPIAKESLPSGSMKANPREAKLEDLVNILKENF